MSYRERLQPVISLVSPSGREFAAKWAGNDRSLDKSVGVFKTPGVQGVITQDLEVEGVVYPLRFWFDGPDNDLLSRLFFEACREQGLWSVVHPVHGTKSLQLISVTEAVNPVSSGGVTEFNTEWLEVVREGGAQSAAQIASAAISQSQVVADVGATQFAEDVELDSAAKAGAVRSATGKTISAFDSTLKSITDQVSEVAAQVSSIKRGIDATLIEPVIDIISLAGQIQALIALPALVITDISAKIETVGNFAEQVFAFSPTEAKPENINVAEVQQIAVTSSLGVATTGAVTSVLASRQSALDTITALLALFDDVTNGLDATQELYSGQLLSQSYFSQSQTYFDSALMIALAVAHLVKSVFGLAAEKRFTLIRAENPVILAMREYSGPGVDDSSISLFYDSNQLTGQETLLLPAGKEVVVYL